VKTIHAAGRELGLYGSGGPTFLLLTGQEGAGAVYETARGLTARPFTLAAFPVEDWDEELSPGRAEKVFRGGRDFGCGAEATLRLLEREILPALNAAGPVFLAGYSLAGLFALWALYESRAFAGAVSASGSLWFPGFREYAESRDFPRSPDRLYLSLGDRESRTRNPVMAAVEENTRALAALYRARGLDCVFELNPGNHFRDPELRLAKGIAEICR
jgi:hypothetical protein